MQSLGFPVRASAPEARTLWCARAAPGPSFKLVAIGRRITPGAVTYDLRRLRLHGLIKRIPHTHRYEVAQHGLRYALFYGAAYGKKL